MHDSKTHGGSTHNSMQALEAIEQEIEQRKKATWSCAHQKLNGNILKGGRGSGSWRRPWQVHGGSTQVTI
jgi:hypothetical protein